MTELTRFALAGGAAFLGAAINAIAGGGSLITFPALVAGGLPGVAANVTNQVAMLPGYLGATLAQRKELAGQRAHAVRLFPAGAVGGLIGAALLLHTGEAMFAAIVPYLILFAGLLLAVQERLRRWLLAHASGGHSEAWAILPIGVASIYGGYFGAGLGVMLLAALAVVVGDTLTRLNAIKQGISLTCNAAAAARLVFSDQVDWPVAEVMFVAAFAGGVVGGVIASRIPPAVLRWTVVALAVVVGVAYLARR
ncbi:MAG TPA: sulfite exporter TauE/SafE family protein [Kofleriaceae bacterium]|nr:sulfite exporter TauE/SafE family protein [Kofleriaceae bacterium]